jgi:hypothetical protein
LFCPSPNHRNNKKPATLKQPDPARLLQLLEDDQRETKHRKKRKVEKKDRKKDHKKDRKKDHKKDRKKDDKKRKKKDKTV